MFSIWDSIPELLWPTRCILCDEPGELLCESCRNNLNWIDQRWACPNCGAPFGYIACTECDAPKGEPWESRACICALPLESAGRKLAIAHKDKHERRLAAVIAAIMATSLDEASAWPAQDGLPRFDVSLTDAICFVPATKEAYQRRGFDHMETIARNLSQMLCVPYADILARPYGKDQRRLTKDERIANTQAAIEVISDIQSCNLLLVDDVITTGSSVRAATQALLTKGAKSVTVCSLARTW